MSPGATLLFFFAGGASGSDPATLTLPGAICYRFNSDASTAWIDGGLTYGLAKEDPGDTYATMHLISERREFTSGPGYVLRSVYQFDCYGPTAHDAESVQEDVLALFNHIALMARPLRFVGGRCFAAFAGIGGNDLAEEPNERGIRLHHRRIDVTFLSDRQFA